MQHKSSSVIRLHTDWKNMERDPPEGCSAAPIDESDLYVWNASVVGPEQSPWEGGLFTLKLTFSEAYPSKPPKVRFQCKMFHPNIYKDGNICLDIVQDKWSPVYTVGSILTSIQSLLCDPNVDSPANPEAAQLYLSDRKAYDRKVRKCAEDSMESALVM